MGAKNILTFAFSRYTIYLYHLEGVVSKTMSTTGVQDVWHCH